MNYEQMTLLVNGVPVLNDQQTLTAAGVKDGDVLQAFPVNAAQLAQQLGQRQQQQQQRNRPVDYKEKARELMRTAPRAVIRERWTALADAMDANDIDKVANVGRARCEETRGRRSFGEGRGKSAGSRESTIFGGANPAAECRGEFYRGTGELSRDVWHSGHALH